MTTMSDTTQDEQDGIQVLIVGAGPTGLTLACDLARRGVPALVIDAAPGPQPGSRGKGIQPRSLEVFEDLQIADRVLSNGRLAMPIRSTGPDGRVTLGGAEPEALKGRPDIPYTTSLITPEWRIEEALRLRLAELGREVEFGSTLISFEQTESGVSAVVSCDGGVRTLGAQWLVGCDGGHSVVRRHTGIAFVGETREDVRMIVGDVGVSGLDRETWQMWRSAEGFLALCPLPSTDVFQYQAGIAPGQNAELSLANMQAILERRSGRRDIRLHDPTWTSLWRANVRLVERYRQGRVFLAGDAAHIHSPAGGQGMNTGIQDAYNLGWKIAAVVDGASADLLDTYAAERRPVAAGVLALSDGRLKETLERNAVPINRDTSTTQLGVNYRGGPLAAVDSGDSDDAATLRAGDRAPDATHLRTVDGEHRLFDLLRGGHFTLLNFTATDTDRALPGVRTLRVVDQPAEPGQVADTGGHLVDAYGATDRTLVLIRPDGYIAVMSGRGDVEVIANYVAAVSRRPVTVALPAALATTAGPDPDC